MAISKYQQFPALLYLFAGAIMFFPELSSEQRSIGTTGLWLTATLLSFLFSPKQEPKSKLPRIIWSERDEGEKFSIIMFHLLLATFGMFIAYLVALEAIAVDGALWLIIPAALIAASTVWMIWTNWSNRNAR
jgi:hypothetical protein